MREANLIRLSAEPAESLKIGSSKIVLSSCFPQNCYLGPITHGFDGQASSQRSEHRVTEITESESTKLT